MVPLAVALGLNLWLLTLGVPLLLAPRPAALVLFLAPLPLLGLLSLLWPQRAVSRPVLLLGVPLLTFLPIADGPLAEAALHPRPAVALQALVLLAYLLVTSRALVAPAAAGAEAPVTITALPPRPLPERWRRRLMLYRFLPLFSAATPALLLYALLWHPPTQRALQLSFGPPERVAAVQAGLTAALALLLAILFHYFLAGPLRAHLLQDRRLGAELQAMMRVARRGRPRPQFYVAMLLALLSMALLIHRSLRS